MSLYSLAASPRSVQPWSETMALGKRLRDFYPSLGDLTVTTPTQIATIQDGPEKVVRYGNLTVASTLTASQRCKGLTIICDSLTVQSGGVLHMNGRGARVDRNDDPRFPFVDFLIPNAVSLSSEVMSKKAALALLARHGWAFWDRGFWEVDGMGALGVNTAVAQPGEVVLLQAMGCGGFTTGAYVYNTWIPGVTGAAGVNGGMGSGGSGGVHGGSNHACSFRAGAGCPYSGGSGSGGVGNNQGNTVTGPASSPYSGPGGNGGLYVGWNTSYCPFPGDQSVLGAGFGGGGAGNPPGRGAGRPDGSSGCGGKLVVICHGDVTVQAGGMIEANGCNGGTGSDGSTAWGGGGGSGGGHVSVIHSGTLGNAGTIQAVGGAGGPGGGSGGSGGAGSVVTKTFAQMGSAWA